MNVAFRLKRRAPTQTKHVDLNPELLLQVSLQSPSHKFGPAKPELVEVRGHEDSRCAHLLSSRSVLSSGGRSSGKSPCTGNSWLLNGILKCPFRRTNRIGNHSRS